MLRRVMGWGSATLFPTTRAFARAFSGSSVHAVQPTTAFGRFAEGQPVVMVVGQFETATAAFSAQDVLDFARLSGDNNPIHTSEEEAKQSR
jgi:acyl dehydratase